MRTTTSTRISSGKNLLLLALVALYVFAALGCKETGGIGGSEQAVFNAEPASISFSRVNLGESEERSVYITNGGAGTLRLSNIRIEPYGGGSADAFHYDESWPSGEVELTEEDSLTLRVTYRPTAQTNYRAVIRMNTNVAGLPEAEIPISTQGLVPELFSPSMIDFARTPANTTEWRVTNVRNIGAAPLVIDHIILENGEEFDVSFVGELDEDGNYPPASTDTDSFPDVLQPDEGFMMRVWFNPTTDNPVTDRILITSNDPNSNPYTINLSGNSGAACLEVSHREGLAFGLATIGQSTYRTVTMRNCAPATELDISNIAITENGGGVFYIRPNSLPGNLPDQPHTLQPQETATVVVGYQPGDDSSHSGELVITSNDGANPQLRIPITGTGTDRQCPIANARGRVSTSAQWQPLVVTSPLETVNLSATGSSDPDGGSLTYEWSVINRPGGSTSQLQPSATAQDPSFWVDVAGIYEIELTAFNDIGMASCETSIVEINSLPTEDILVELTWNSPNTPNPVVGHGTDLDLHYLHQNGTWGDLQWSVFWQRRSQSWDGGSASLDWDSLYGEAPENVNHANPMPGNNYHVGVHYYSDYSNGASDATIRVYFGQTLAYEKRNRRIQNVNDLWRVGVIQWDIEPNFVELDNITNNHCISSALGPAGC